ncbi:small nuclear ribonucleoprotein G-like [Pocillopora verrucosa]|uniref:small nuclear ribonucleoprotein G-like n=1 Tax=Pocillopora verrucosa TaxID=203993 RepID=UPI003340A321
MSKTHPPELKKYMDKRLSRNEINGGRHVTGVLRGFDPFMNLVLDEAVEEVSAQEKHNIGMVVIRGNSIVIMEALDRIS